ncbi:MAG: type VI secretion system baseplate subunit TssK [Oceanospirillaceae bacterium]|uniref:type VI secretion system baseplate subunit TssK n=1 Tax=unclassified Thalassolituus TaxID=2624967 RepID=UPI000C0A482C|nr:MULTISPECIES: type VI secretion system baseplate subunit TssK [unclassified Thalassolituus]MAK90639.1 type VI secretion system baseplate subunit TssK [Thalassolituus sp.]MAS24019.1 type VI secretion system baseplate subunit TssK [Oceanospirillaceae bacterium]MAY01235.1 type VI secretion system baseplate subunit TssK [Oceanospirillaceae bacterium]MBL36394.1 type VI secretion system baseplate subunit TssK [Oceanospirillaceae bacterium]MBS52541.1 type VI secretion system baseplate subunit TssK
MPKVKSVFWRQGMFLQPQHFQYAELSQEEKLSQVRYMSRPWFWGVRDLSLANEALAIRQIEVESGSFVFQDGAIATINENASIQSRSLENIEVDPERPMDVYIGLRKLSQIDPNVTIIHNNTDVAGVSTRYYTDAAPVAVDDVYLNDQQAELQPLVYKLKIILPHELEDYADYHVIPVARIALDGEKLIFMKSFIPPLINLEASASALSIVKELRDELSGRAFQLSSIANASASQNFDPNMLRYRLGLQALSRYVPRFYHMSETPSVSPWDVYGFMRELVGEVSIFSRSINFLGENKDGESLLPAYEHTNLWDCFNAARTLITQLLNEISVGPQFLVEFERNDTRFTVDIPAEFFEDQVDFYLILNTEAPWSDHSQSFLTTAKLAEADMIDILIERSLPGIGVLHMPGPPPGLPKKNFANYARIDIHDEKWNQVINKKSLGLMWDEAPEDLKIELVILRK